MKGLILAGGTGSRLFPATLPISKHLLPIYDKPMIYYPLSTLMLAGITDIAIITRPEEESVFRQLLQDGSQWGITLTYLTQASPKGIADAFIIAEQFIGDDSCSLMLGDNIIYSDGLAKYLQRQHELTTGAVIFGYYVRNPEHYGVVHFDDEGAPEKIIEKPKAATSNYAIPGLYFYDNQVIEVAKQLQPSARGELEITSINQWYLDHDLLTVETLGRGVAWLDTGTPETMLEAAQFIEVLEKRQDLKIGCPEEVAWRMGLINTNQLELLAEPLLQSGYGSYLLSLVRR